MSKKEAGEKAIYHVAGKEVEYVEGVTPSSNVSPLRQRFFMLDDGIVWIPKDCNKPAEVMFNETLERLRLDKSNYSYDECDRGYMTQDSICVYRTSYTLPIQSIEIKPIVADLIDGHRKMFGYRGCDVALWTGCMVSEEGTVWPPIVLAGYFDRVGQYHEIQ